MAYVGNDDVGTVWVGKGAVAAKYSAYPQVSGLGIGASPGTTAGLTFDGTNFANRYAQLGGNNAAVQFGGASTGITYSLQGWGNQSIGLISMGNVNIVLTNKGSSTGNATIINALPYAASNVFFMPLLSGNIFFTEGYDQGWVTTNAGSTTLSLAQTGNGVGQIPLTDANFANNTVLQFNVLYITV